MKLKGLIDYDICNYCLPSMFLIFPYCSFKCDHECGKPVCQNSDLAREPIIDIEAARVVQRYLDNPLTHAVVCGGLEPFDSKDELYWFIGLLRAYTDDAVVIYTGYTEDELAAEIPTLQKFDNIIVKFGRFIPDSPHIFDALLGVELASNNQYVKEMYAGEHSRKNSGENLVHE